MASEPTGRAPVFLNFPFDSHYEKLYIALIAGVTSFDLAPRCVLEIKTTTDRLSRLHELMAECRYSIHDLSRVQLAKGAPRCPRFNMPFELGMAIARAQTVDKAHQWIVLEEMPHRLQKSLSDLNGYDSYIHHGTVTGLLQALLDAFESTNHLVSTTHMRVLYRRLRTVAQQLRLLNRWPDLYRAAAFRQLAVAARSLNDQGT